MAIGIGEKNYSGSKISESNGPAFVFAGEKFDRLKKRENQPRYPKPLEGIG
ncbi:hypothetical protein [Algoriphagus boritolerans]|uniref:hypothetical protein n=1 Tax=Algoriphagus boritolerans TaxID=308111 RepID=UPI000A65BDF4